MLIFYGVWAMKSSTTTQVLCCISLSQWLTWLFGVYAGLYYHILLSYPYIYIGYIGIIMIHHYKDPYIKHQLFATFVFFSWFYTWRKSSVRILQGRGDLERLGYCSTWGVNFIGNISEQKTLLK